MKLIVAIAFILITSSYAVGALECFQCQEGPVLTAKQVTDATGTPAPANPNNPANPVIPSTRDNAGGKGRDQSLNDQNPVDNTSLRKLRRSTAFQHHKRYFRNDDKFPEVLDSITVPCATPLETSNTNKEADVCYIMTMTVAEEKLTTVRFGGKKDFCENVDKKFDVLKDFHCGHCSTNKCDKGDKGDGGTPTKSTEKAEPTKSTEKAEPTASTTSTEKGGGAAGTTAKPADESSASRIEYGFSQLFLLVSMVLFAWLKK